MTKNLKMIDPTALSLRELADMPAADLAPWFKMRQAEVGDERANLELTAVCKAAATYTRTLGIGCFAQPYVIEPRVVDGSEAEPS
jgi:hypothetical protein